MHALYRRLDEAPTLLLLGAALFWGCNAVFGQLAKGNIGPLTLVMARWTLVALIMWPLYGRQVREHWPTLRPLLPKLILLSMCGFTAFNTLMYVAAYTTTALNIGILQGAGPVFVLLGAFAIFGERPGPLQLVGVAITILGVAVVASKGALGDLLGITLALGDGLMLLAIALYAAYTLGISRRPAMPGAAFFTLLAVIAAIGSAPLGIYEIATSPAPTAYGVGLAVLVALFPSLLAQLFFLRGVEHVGPSQAMLYINFVPVFASIMAVLLLRETFHHYHAIALGLVTLGVLAAQRGGASIKG